MCEIMNPRLRGFAIPNRCILTLRKRMNWHSGLLRLWLVLTFLWILFGFVIERPYSTASLFIRINKAVPVLEERLSSTVSDDIFVPTSGKIVSRVQIVSDLDRLRVAQVETRGKLVDFATFALGPPIMLLFLGLLTQWVLAGFRQGRPS